MLTLTRVHGRRLSGGGTAAAVAVVVALGTTRTATRITTGITNTASITSTAVVAGCRAPDGAAPHRQ